MSASLGWWFSYLVENLVWIILAMAAYCVLDWLAGEVRAMFRSDKREKKHGP